MQLLIWGLIVMKACYRCGDVKPLVDFYRHPHAKDGHINKCKSCTKHDVRKHRADHDSVREYDRQRAKRPERRAANRKVVVNWRECHPEKYKAQTAVSNAIRDGKLKKGTECEVCGTKRNLHAHHDDYSKPLGVRWLCARCHHVGHAAKT